MAAKTDPVIGNSSCQDQETPTHVVITNACKQPSRKIKPIPPPLDLSKRGPIDESSSDIFSDLTTNSISPKSPLNSNQKHLPFRKRAFSWTTFCDDGSSSSSSPGPSSATIQRSTYSAFIPASPHMSRLTVIKQESIDQSDVFTDCLIKNEIKEEPEFDKDDYNGTKEYRRVSVGYPPPQSPAFPTPVTPSPLSPINFPPTPSFFPQHFQSKITQYPWPASTLLSPAPSLHSSSQEELTQHRPWKYEESDVDDVPIHFMASKRDDAFHSDLRDDYNHSDQQPGTSELCERFQRFDFAIPTARNKDKRFYGNGEESSSSASSSGPMAAKRPMNGFMLFAQKYRLQLIQQFPGRDNRAISVMLGEAWKRLNPAEKEMYTAEAHMRAEEYRRLYPDCWKRKRSKSTS